MNDTYLVQLTWRQWIAWRRGNLDMTKEGLAQVMDFLGHDISRQTLWRIETGRGGKVTQNTRLAIETALDACEAARTATSEAAA